MATGTIVKDTTFLIATKTYTNITFGATGYVSLDTITSMATSLNIPNISDYTLISMMIKSFTDGKIYSLARGSNANAIYAIGTANTTEASFGVQYVFAKGTVANY